MTKNAVAMVRAPAVNAGRRYSDPDNVPSNSITPSLVAHRTSGAAPFIVYFDATATECSLVDYPLHDLTYFFDYDDPGSGVFTTTGNSKNTKMGPPIGAHTFETPGDYQPSLIVRLGVPWPAEELCAVGKIAWIGNKTWQCHTEHTSGTTFSSTNWTELFSSYQDSTEVFEEITAINADTYYPGTATIVVDPGSSWAGAPSGAQLVTSLSGVDFNNHRVLLARGVGTSYGSITIGANNSDLGTGDHDFIIGAVGTGSAPIVDNVNFASGPASANWSQVGVVMDLNVMRDLTIYCTARNILFLRCNATDTSTISNDNSRFVVGGSTGFLSDQTGAGNEAADEIYWPEYVFLVDCVGLGTLGAGHNSGSGGGSMPQIITGGVFDKGAIMGCEFNFTREQTSRIFMAHNLLSSDNEMGGEVGLDNTRGAMKLQGLGGDTIASTVIAARNPKTDGYFSVDDRWGKTTGNTNFLGGAGPENTENVGVQRIQNISYWRLTFQRGSVWAADFQHISNLVSMHGCVALDNEGDPTPVSGNCISYEERGSFPDNPALYGPYLHGAEAFA